MQTRPQHKSGASHVQIHGRMSPPEKEKKQNIKQIVTQFDDIIKRENKVNHLPPRDQAVRVYHL